MRVVFCFTIAMITAMTIALIVYASDAPSGEDIVQPPQGIDWSGYHG